MPSDISMTFSRTVGEETDMAYRVTFGVNDLETMCPEVAKEWDVEKNGGVEASEVAYKSNKKAWWRCSICGNEWEMVIASHSIRGAGCPKCKRAKADRIRYAPKDGQSLSDKYPEIADEWDVDKNEGRLPGEYTCGSDYKAWWRCPDYGHSYQRPIQRRTSREDGCPYCSGRKVLAGFNDLATTHPDIATQWDYDKNFDTPRDVTHGSTKKRYWICSCGNSWLATVSSRVLGTGCPECAKKSRGEKSGIPSEGQSLAEVSPDIAAEWHPTLNGDKTPSDYTYASGSNAWWLCPKGHAYETAIHNRNSGSNCPYCSGRRVLEGFNDLRTTNPTIAEQWHPSKNGDLRPEDFSRGSDVTVWWKCDIGHEWQAKVVDRAIGGNGCPFCHRGRHESFSEKAIAYYVSKHYPDAKMNCQPEGVDFGKSELDIWIPSTNTAIEYDGGRWHQDVQRDIAKDDACVRCGIRLIRVRDEKCPEYDSQSIIVRREKDTGYETLNDAILRLFDVLGIEDNDIDTRRDSAYIYKMHGDGRVARSLAILHPDVAKEWHPTKNGSLTPDMVYPRSTKSAWWVCPNGHEYEAIIANRSAGHGCWQCRNELISKQRSVPALGHSLLEKCPSIASEWVRCVDDETLTPSTISYGSDKRVVWKCSYCGKIFEQGVQRRTRRGDNAGCGSCKIGIKLSKPKPGRSLADAAPEIASQWHPTKNGNLTPRDVSVRSSKKVWWIDDTGREWEAVISNRARYTKDS